MRTITDHKLNGLNDHITITATDEPGPGGANHRYDIIGMAPEKIPNIGPGVFGVNLCFQNGPIAKPEDMNGITNEALLAVLIDRMRGVQGMNPVTDKQCREDSAPPGGEQFRAPFACRENALALTHLEEALMWLQKRTRDRVARGVEGSSVP